MPRTPRKPRRSRARSSLLSVLVLTAAPAASAGAQDDAPAPAPAVQLERGLAAVLGLPVEGGAARVVELAKASELTVYFQDPGASAVDSVRRAAETAGLLGVRVFAGIGGFDRIGLASNLSGVVLVSSSAEVTEDEVLRVLHPGGRALWRGRSIGKSPIEGTDSWSHPYHSPDNNPQSSDRLARAPYLTQFLAEPKFCPMPQVSVAAGGKVYRAFGHIAHKANQNAMLNTLIGVNAYNGTVLWKRSLNEGFMVHRNTLVATPDRLLLADDESLKLIEPETGAVDHEIVVPDGAADGPVWKWMGLAGGDLYALVGGEETGIATQKSDTPGLGHWPWGMWKGHDYADPRTNFGFGRNFIAVDLESRKILWNHREEDYADSRAVCMKGGRIYFYSPENHLACLDARQGELLWRNRDPELLEAIGKNGPAQHYVTGYATTAYIKCTDEVILFAGPQRSRLVAASTEDGRLLWERTGGNLQLVLREDGIYAAGPATTGVRLDYRTGEVLAQLPARRACTRATGSIDSVFYRTTGGTVRLDTEAGTAQHIAPMRPPCQDGVIISSGHLYWGPWMCGCQLSLYGHIALGPAGDFDLDGPDPATRLEVADEGALDVAPLATTPEDWPCYRGDNRRSGAADVAIPASVERLWEHRLESPVAPTAAVAVADLVLFGDRSGVVRCLDAEGEERWKVYTGGSVYYPPAVEAGRAFAGSADGHVYALEVASGRLLWRFRLAPEERRIPVYGSLISTWPVAGGVAVEDGTVYAAAGIAHYDGTHVAALDAATGKVKWYNSRSGRLSESAQSGISLQGVLSIENGELRFAGGGRQQVARFDLVTGRCLNEPHPGVTSRFQTAFYPYFPEYGEYLPCRRDYDDGRTLIYEASYEGSRHHPLVLLAPGSTGGAKEAPRRSDVRRDRRAAGERRRRESLWSIEGERYNGIVTAPNGALAAGRRGETAFLAAIELEKGRRMWEIELPSPAVRGGVAVDRRGRVLVSLQDGRVACYGER